MSRIIKIIIGTILLGISAFYFLGICLVVADAKEDAVIDAIINDSDMEIPEPMLETQQKQLVDDFAQRIQMQGINIE